MNFKASDIQVSIHASVKDATYIRECCQCWIMVSIHASVKDATDEDGRAFKVDFVSIHASVKDATSASSFNPMAYLFQSTHL